MSPVLSTSSPTLSLVPRCGLHMRLGPVSSCTSARGETLLTSKPLASYIDAYGRLRELLALPGHGGSVLVLDRDGATLCDRMLIAHLAPDEPPENAVLICRHYLEDTNGRWCRRMQPEDLEILPLGHIWPEPEALSPECDTCIADRDGNTYRLAPLPNERSVNQMCWCRLSKETGDHQWEQTSLREVVGALQSYEPMRTLTEHVLQSHDLNFAVTRLCCEFDRLCSSPVVLNRGLREAVLSSIHLGGTSMSEIALRCGVVKRDRRGKVSGETSWLARRIGIMPEGGEKKITPWIHSDVLATIAREGLGVSPREVELQ